MAGGKETPRQRMIGILYLVLLGLIALDVPENLLDSFKNISDSLNASKTNVQTGINNSFDAFEKTKLKEEHERAAPIYEKAKKAKKLSDDLDAYVESLKKELVDATGGMDEETGDYEGREDLAASDHLMVGGEKKAAYELHKKIDDTRTSMLALLEPKERVGMNLSLQATAPKARAGFPNKDWEQANFGDGIPMGAAMTAFVKIQSDIKNSENEVIKKILGKIDQATVTLDKFSAVAVAPTSYVLSGQPYTAQVFLTAYDSKSKPDITVDGASIPTADGKGTYTVTTSGEGMHTWVGKISVKNNSTSKTEIYTISQTYQVAKPSAVISPDKMNVLYIGVPNPISISAPGVPKESLKVNMSSGSISGKDGKYTATVSTIGTAKITVTGDKGTLLGTTDFRIKRIPDPKPMFAGKSGGNTSAANLRAQDRVFAKLDNFDFDAKFNVTRFTLVVIKPRQDAIIIPTSGADLNSAMKAVMATVAPGTIVVFKDIIAVGPDGTQRGLDPITLSAN